MAESEITLTPPPGGESLLLGTMRGTEYLGQPFEYALELMSEKDDVKLEDLLGKKITVHLALRDGGKRHFNGFVSRFSYTGWDGKYARYEAIVRPWCWFLTRKVDCRIFQEMTVPEILKKVFKDQGFSDYDFQLNGSYRTWDYCVQYRETDFDFASRLMEQEGIYYYFRHESDKHVMVVGDNYGSHGKVKDYEEVPFYPPSESLIEEEHLDNWLVTQEVQPGGYALNDYDFEKPKASMQVRATRKRDHPMSDRAFYDYPGEYVTTAEGDHYAKVRLNQWQSHYEVARGSGNPKGLHAGCLFSLSGLPRQDQNREYLVVSARYSLQCGPYESDGSGAGGGGDHYWMGLAAIESKQEYRTPERTRKPWIRGPQTAVVVGPSGEEIYTDKYGRVKVQFHWDREGKQNENSSCWVRVAQVWAGTQWGAIHIPRIGQEVIVEFLEGDPDRPIITGRVYNADQMPPYDLPANMTQSGIKSRSSKGGTSENFNEIRFEDKKGAEEIVVHAERNLATTVEADETRDVGGNRTTNIHVNESLTVDADRDTHVKGSFKETIDAGETRTVHASSTESIDGGQTRTVDGGLTETINGGVTQTINGGETRTVNGGVTETINGGETRSINGGLTESINGALTQTITGGATISTPGTVTIQAAGGINLLAPGGTHIVDNQLVKFGGSDITVYGYQVASVIAKAELIGFAMTLTSVKIDIASFVVDVKGVLVDNKPMTLRQFGTSLKQGGLDLYLRALSIFM